MRGKSSCPNIGGYETVFNQENGDGIVGIDVGTLQDIETDKNGHQLKIDSLGGAYIGNNDFFAVKDAAGGTPSLKISQPWSYKYACLL